MGQQARNDGNNTANAFAQAAITLAWTRNTIAAEEAAGALTGPGEIPNQLVAGGIGVVGVGVACYQACGALAVSVGDQIDKMAREIGGILSKPRGPEAEQNSLRAIRAGQYPNVRGGFTGLKAGDVWKYGKSISGSDRYPASELSALGVRYVTEFSGGEMQALMQEKFKIYSYFLEHGKLPPGNRIFR